MAALLGMGPQETSDHPLYGRMGPTYAGELLKRSDHIREWRPRWFQLRERRLYYYDSGARAAPPASASPSSPPPPSHPRAASHPAHLARPI